MLVHTIALELNQRDEKQEGGRGGGEEAKKGQRLVLLTASQRKVNTTSMTAGGQLFQLSAAAAFQVKLLQTKRLLQRTDMEQTVKPSVKGLVSASAA